MRYLVICIIAFIQTISFSQDKPKNQILNEIGFWPGFGYGNSNKSLPEGNYQPYYFLFHVGFSPFENKSILSQRFQFYVEPQYNYVELV